MINATDKALAELVFREGKIIERTAFMLGDAYKVSYVFEYEGKQYYITLTDEEITYFHQGGLYDK